MKKYIRTSSDYDYYCVIRIDKLYNDIGYFGGGDSWYDQPYSGRVKEFSKSGAYAAVRRFNARNTDDTLTYAVERLDNIVYA